MLDIKNIKVGDVFVAFAGSSPCQCNSEGFPDQPCRVRISKVGRTRVYASLSGHKNPMPMSLNDQQSGLTLVSIEEAKRRYRKSLEDREIEVAKKGYSILSSAQIEDLVNRL